VPGCVVVAADCVLVIVEVTAWPSTEVEVTTVVVVLSSDVEAEVEDADPDLTDDTIEECVDDKAEELLEFELEAAEVVSDFEFEAVEAVEAAAPFVTVEGCPETVFVRSIVTGKTMTRVLPCTVCVTVVCITRVNSVVAVVVMVCV